MTIWATRSLSQQARVGGSTTHTHTFTQPSAGQLLYAICMGAVTFTTPSGWTLQQSAVNNGGMYLFSKTATGSETSLTTTVNGANYPSVAVIYAFPSGSTAGLSANKINAGTGSYVGAALTGLTGTNYLGVAGNQNNDRTATNASWGSWSNSAIEDTDVSVVQVTTDGYSAGTAYLEDSVLTSWTPTATVTSFGGTSAEAITFAVSVGAGGGAPAIPPIIVLAPRR